MLIGKIGNMLDTKLYIYVTPKILIKFKPLALAIIKD